VFLGSFPTLKTATILATFGLVFTAGYILWTVKRIFYGAFNPKWAHLEDMGRAYEFAPLIILVALTVLVGVAPSLIVDWSRPALLALLR